MQTIYRNITRNALANGNPFLRRYYTPTILDKTKNMYVFPEKDEVISNYKMSTKVAALVGAIGGFRCSEYEIKPYYHHRQPKQLTIFDYIVYSSAGAGLGAIFGYFYPITLPSYVLYTWIKFSNI